jgi:hypothetical protein
MKEFRSSREFRISFRVLAGSFGCRQLGVYAELLQLL